MDEFDLVKVQKFLSILFNETDDIHISGGKNKLNVVVTAATGRKVYKPNVPFNVKNNGTLGWFDEELNLCLLPIKDNRYELRNGCNRNKSIRPLHATFDD